MRIWLCQGSRRVLKVDMNLPFIFIKDRLLVNTARICFPKSKVEFFADHIHIDCGLNKFEDQPERRMAKVLASTDSQLKKLAAFGRALTQQAEELIQDKN